MSTTTLEHPTIGNVIGSAASEDVSKYLGIQYATLVDRFSPPQIKEYPQGGTVDATKYGPQVLALPNGADFEYTLLQKSLEYDREAVRMSDIDGLNLNIYTPTAAAASAASKSGLPVFVFIHGGAFNGGSASFPAYEMTRVVRLSIARKMPIIVVSLNYRLGAPGFFFSDEMRQAGYLPNNGLRDQRTALLWLQNHIAGFGGDPDRVTLMGQSAGAVSTSLQLHSEKPLFERAIMMSGSSLLLGPVPTAVAEASYHKAMRQLYLDGMTPEDRMKALLEMDGQKLRATLLQGGFSPLPVVDGDICPTGVDFKSLIEGDLNLAGKKWCKSLILGDCEFDGSILGLPLGGRKSGIAQAFSDSISASLPEQAATRLLSDYGIPSSSSDDEALTRVLEFANDICFYTPTLAFAQGMQDSMPVYMYRFNEPNPWPGPWHGRTSHIHDLVVLLQTFSQFMNSEQTQLGEEFAADVIAFVNGQDPWQRWTKDENVAKVFKVGSERVVQDTPENTERRRTVLDLADNVGFDTLKGAFTRFLVGG